MKKNLSCFETKVQLSLFTESSIKLSYSYNFLNFFDNTENTSFIFIVLF